MNPKHRELIAKLAKSGINNKEKKGVAGEWFAKEWFQRNSIDFYPIPQSKETMPISLSKAGGKRPDFAVLLQDVDSVLYMDAKYYNTKGLKEFSLTNEELGKFVIFREWAKEEYGDIGSRDIFIMVYPQEANGEKFTWVHLDELLNGEATEIGGLPGKKISLEDREDCWVLQDQVVASNMGKTDCA